MTREARIGVLFAPISYAGPEYWQSECGRLSRLGLFTRTFRWGPDRDETLIREASALRADGAEHVVVIGACYGGNVALRTADVIRPAAVIAVSALASLPDDPESMPQSPGAVVLVSSTADPLVPEAEAERLRHSHPGSRLVLYSGVEHGIEIFEGPRGDELPGLVDEVVAEVAAGAVAA